MKKKFLKVGVIGCGRVFDHYLNLFKKKKIPLMKIVACCDKNPEILRRKIQTEDIRNYTKPWVQLKV